MYLRLSSKADCDWWLLSSLIVPAYRCQIGPEFPSQSNCQIARLGRGNSGPIWQPCHRGRRERSSSAAVQPQDNPEITAATGGRKSPNPDPEHNEVSPPLRRHSDGSTLILDGKKVANVEARGAAFSAIDLEVEALTAELTA